MQDKQYTVANKPTESIPGKHVGINNFYIYLEISETGSVRIGKIMELTWICQLNSKEGIYYYNRWITLICVHKLNPIQYETLLM